MLSLTAIGPVLKLLKQFGADKILTKLGRAEVEKKFEKAVGETAADLEQDGFTPAQLAADGSLSDADRRQVVRGCLFRLLRFGVFTFKGGGNVADIVRDTYDDKVCALVGPKITAQTSAEEAARLTLAGVLDVAF